MVCLAKLARARVSVLFRKGVILMSGPCSNAVACNGQSLELVPRMKDQGYAQDEVAYRRCWVEQRTGCHLEHVGSSSFPSESLRGNVENPIGTAQVPLGVAGPLLIHGQYARGTFYVPMATC